MADEEKIIDLETRLAFSEDQFRQLSDVVYEMNNTMELLKKKYNDLASRMDEIMEEVRQIPENERPPHY